MRLPSIPASEINDHQRQLYDALIDHVRENFSGIATTADDGALLGPWGVWIQVPDIGSAMLKLIKAIGALPGLSARARQVAILVTAAKFNAAYEIYAHNAIAKDDGLSDAQIATLLAGARPDDLGEDETIAADIALALLRGGPLPEPLYTAGRTLMGQDGLNGLIFTVAQYSLVGVMLNGYAVPAPAGDRP
jgi:4-carboxymuconolactone decarboxylase